MKTISRIDIFEKLLSSVNHVWTNLPCRLTPNLFASISLSGLGTDKDLKFLLDLLLLLSCSLDVVKTEETGASDMRPFETMTITQRFEQL